MAQELTAKRLMEVGLSRSFAHHIMAKTRDVSVSTALWLLDEHGITVRQLEGKTKRELELLRGLYPPRAPKTVVERQAASAEAA